MVKLPAMHPEWGRFRNHRGLVTRPAIKKLVERIAAKFHPEKIILFGSYAYGEPDEWSDVDLLVVMPARNQISQSLRIWNAVDPPFSVDLIVRTPENMKWRLEEGDWFLREIMAKGKVVYEKTDRGVDQESRSRHPGRKRSAKSKAVSP